MFSEADQFSILLAQTNYEVTVTQLHRLGQSLSSFHHTHTTHLMLQKSNFLACNSDAFAFSSSLFLSLSEVQRQLTSFLLLHSKWQARDQYCKPQLKERTFCNPVLWSDVHTEKRESNFSQFYSSLCSSSFQFSSRMKYRYIYLRALSCAPLPISHLFPFIAVFIYIWPSEDEWIVRT
jgi:hypothetical protein